MEEEIEMDPTCRGESREFEYIAEIVVASCDRYDELAGYWEGRELPDLEELAAAIADPNARRTCVERALVALSRLPSSRARALLEWYEPLAGQADELEYVAKVCRLEWRDRFVMEREASRSDRVA